METLILLGLSSLSSLILLNLLQTMPALSLQISKTCRAEKAVFLALADWLTTPVLGRATFFKNISTQKRIASILVGGVEGGVRGRTEEKGTRPAGDGPSSDGEVGSSASALQQQGW